MMLKILLLIVILTNILLAGTESDKLLIKNSIDSLDQDIEIKDRWFGRDKGLHLAAGFITSGFITLSTRRFAGIDEKKSRYIALSVTFSLSLSKEIYDSRQSDNHFSFKDLTADLLGIAMAILVFR